MYDGSYNRDINPHFEYRDFQCIMVPLYLKNKLVMGISGVQQSICFYEYSEIDIIA